MEAKTHANMSQLSTTLTYTTEVLYGRHRQDFTG